jgi:hypothetical protein
MAILKIRDANGNVQEIIAIKGKDGKDGENGKDGINGIDGKDGVDGKDYVLTDADKQEIAEIVAEMIKNDIPSAEGVDY